MKNQFTNIRDTWDFEKNLAISNPNVWINEAENLKSSAKILIQNNDKKRGIIFVKKSTARTLFSSGRIIRMLFGFSLENLIKCLLCSKNPNKYFKKEGNINFGKNAHNLIKLFSEAAIGINEEEEFFLKAWSICSVYAGRYPIAKNENHYPKRRKPEKSREDLIERQGKKLDSAIKEGKMPFSEMKDLLASGVEDYEEKIFDTIFNKIKSEIIELKT